MRVEAEQRETQQTGVPHRHAHRRPTTTAGRGTHAAGRFVDSVLVAALLAVASVLAVLLVEDGTWMALALNELLGPSTPLRTVFLVIVIPSAIWAALIIVGQILYALGDGMNAIGALVGRHYEDPEKAMNTAAVSTAAPTRPLPSRLAKDRLSTSIHDRTLAAGAFFDETAVAALGGALVVGLLGFLFDTVWAVDVPDALLVGEPTLGRLALFALVAPMVIGLSFKGLGYALDALAEALERRGFRRLVYVRDRLNRTIGVLWVNAEGSMHRIDGPALVSLTEKDCEVWIAVDGKRCAEGVGEILALQCAAKGLPRVDPENRQAVDWLTHRRAYGEPLPALPVTAVIGALTLHPNP